MGYQQKELCGSLFKNDKREKDTHPNATGTAMIGGVEYWVSAWTKKDKNGNPWQSLAFKVKEAAGAKAAPKGKEFNDDIPNFNPQAPTDDCPF
jgi:hypothetical protein